MNRNTGICIILLGLSVSSAANESPQIVQIRHNYAIVNRELAIYRKETKDGPVCGDISSEYTRWLDKHGKVRKISAHYYGDSYAVGFTENYELWFDPEGRLDFALLQRKDYQFNVAQDSKIKTQGSSLKNEKKTVEMRVYYSDKGQIIRLSNKYPIDKANMDEYLRQFKRIASQDVDGGC